MNMKRLLTLVAFFATVHASAQQVNPVPDYVFANRMSAGRNTVTDTAAYFSIGPRYGATRGMMPPMVVDTASFSANKRNGLLIFSVQKNKFLYWDSVGVKWAEMAGTGGTAISSGDTAAMLLPYVRHAGYGLTKSGQAFFTDTALISTRLRVGKVVDSLSAVKQNLLTNPITGTGTIYRIPIFSGASTLSNSLLTDSASNLIYTGSQGIKSKASTTSYITAESTTDAYINFRDADAASGYIRYNHTSNFLTFGANDDERARINSAGELLLGTQSDAGDLRLQVSGSAIISGNVGIGTTTPVNNGSGTSTLTINGTSQGILQLQNNGVRYFEFYSNGTDTRFENAASNSFVFRTASTERARITSGGEMYIGSSDDAGAYTLQVTGAIYNTTTITTGAPTGGSVTAWRLGEAATVSPTSPNRTLRVEVGGTVYYIAAKTTND